jgi:hypothetical protein
VSSGVTAAVPDSGTDPVDLSAQDSTDLPCHQYANTALQAAQQLEQHVGVEKPLLRALGVRHKDAAGDTTLSQTCVRLMSDIDRLPGGPTPVSQEGPAIASSSWGDAAVPSVWLECNTVG